MTVPLKRKGHTNIIDGIECEKEGQTVIVKYRNTPVATFNDCVIILDTGGWETATTKQRMNQTSREYSLGFSVYQRKFTWYVKHREIEHTFVDHKITLQRREQ